MFYWDTPWFISFLLSITAFTQWQSWLVATKIVWPQNAIYFLSHPLQQVCWPLVYTDQWPVDLPPTSSVFAAASFWCLGTVSFSSGITHVKKTRLQTTPNTKPRLWILSVVSCVTLKMVFPSPRNMHSLSKWKVLLDL